MAGSVVGGCTLAAAGMDTWAAEGSAGAATAVGEAKAVVERGDSGVAGLAAGGSAVAEVEN